MRNKPSGFEATYMKKLEEEIAILKNERLRLIDRYDGMRAERDKLKAKLAKALESFERNLLDNTIEPDPEFDAYAAKHFWELIEPPKGASHGQPE